MCVVESTRLACSSSLQLLRRCDRFKMPVPRRDAIVTSVMVCLYVALVVVTIWLIVHCMRKNNVCLTDVEVEEIEQNSDEIYFPTTASCNNVTSV